MKRPFEDGLSLLLGAGAGMALMYLLDPSEGSRRREAIQRAARQRLARAGDAASAGLEHLHDAVDRAAHTPTVQMLAARAAEAAKGIYSDVGGHVGSALDEAQRQANDAAAGIHSTASERLSQFRGRAKDWAKDWRSAARSRYGKWLKRSSLELGRDEDHHYVGQTVCALSSLALGAGVVYLFDPDKGAQRRMQLLDRTTYALSETGDFFRNVGKRLVTRGRVAARTAADQAKSAVSHLRPSSEPAQPWPVQGQPTRSGSANESSANEAPINESAAASAGT